MDSNHMNHAFEKYLNIFRAELPLDECFDLLERKLCIGGRRAYLYDIGANQFTEMTLFASSTAIKSINYNDDTGELWYTDSTIPEGSQAWSTQTIRYATDRNGSAATRSAS